MTNLKNTTSRTSDSPNNLFKKMAESDVKQNNRLSRNIDVGGINKTDSTEQGTSIRFFICLLGLASLAMSQMSRSVLNITITDMVHPDMLKSDESISTDGSCPWPVEESFEYTNGNSTSSSFNSTQTDSTVSSDNTTYATLNDISDQQVITGDTISPAEPEEEPERFMWTIQDQNVLLGGFFYSYFAFMIVGGRVAELYGAKYVLLLSVAGSGIINLLSPWIAKTSFPTLVASRILMGVIQAGVFPAMYALFNEWLTMTEASIFAPLIKTNLRLGALFGTLTSGFISNWPNVFYLTGALNIAWCILWMIFATSRPKDNRWVSKIELARIMRKKLNKLQDLDQDPKSNEKKQKKDSIPWLKIITAPSVIGLIIIKFTFNLGIDFIAIELPSYLKYVHHLSREKISIIVSSQLVVQTFLIIGVGWLAKTMVQKRPFGITKTKIRKIFQSIACYGIGFGLVALSLNNCNVILIIVVVQVISFLCMFTAGGETMLPYDLSEKYPATIMAIANSVANLSAVTTTTVTALILGDQGGSYARWNTLIYLIAGANIAGATIFNLIVKAEPIDGTSTSADSTKKELAPIECIDITTEKPSTPTLKLYFAAGVEVDLGSDADEKAH